MKAKRRGICVGKWIGYAVIPAFFLGVMHANLPAEAETVRLTLDEAVALGLQNSATLQSKLISVEASQADVRAAKSSYYPVFSANVNWTHYFEQTKSPGFTLGTNGETLEIPAQFAFASDPIRVAFDFSQPLYTFGRIRHGIGLSREGLNLAEMDVSEEQRSLIVNIKEAFYGYILARELVSVQEETLAQREDTLRVARERYEAGLVADFEVLSAESDVENFKPEVISARNQVELALLAVKDLLNITDTEGYDLELIGELSPVYFDFDRQELIDMALGNNYELKQYRSSVNFAQYQESLKKSEKLPIINAFSNYNIQSTFDTATGTNDYSDWDDLLTVGVNVSVPLSALIPYSRESAEKVKSSLDLAALNTNLSSIETGIRIGIESLLLKIKEEEAKINSSLKTEELASRLYESARDQFANGYITRLELREAEIRLNSSRTGYLTAVFNYISALYDLLNIVGIHEFDGDMRRSS
jgi:outer membrane protein TolC